jgi:hypothetical protein
LVVVVVVGRAEWLGGTFKQGVGEYASSLQIVSRATENTFLCSLVDQTIINHFVLWAFICV